MEEVTININNRVKNFIHKYHDWINDPDMHPELVQNAVEELIHRDI